MANSARNTIVLAALAWASAAAAAPADLPAKADAYLKAAYPDAGPGAAVIIVDDGKTVYARGQGLADVEAGRKITPQTVFRLGSITKQFSAAVLLQLVDEGKVSLDDPLSKYVPGFPEPAAGGTVRQLLNHTIGVQSYTGIPGWMVESNTSRAHSTAEMIALFRDLPSPSKPGEEWSYNNSGYVLVGAVIEKVTGKPWHQAVEERIAAPLRLATIRYGVGEAGMANMAKGYTRGETGVVVPAQKIHMSVPHAAGGLVGSVEDMARWARALHHGKVVRPASYAQMTAATKLPDGKTVPYGFGLGLDEVRGHKAIGHNGGIFGFSTDSLYIPEEDLFIAVFANSDQPATSPGVALRRLAAMALGDPYPSFTRVEIAPAALEPLLGVYAVEGGGDRLFFARDGKLFTRRKGAPELEVVAAGGNRFFYGPESLTWFEIVPGADGAEPAMEMHQNGAKTAERALRSGPVPVQAATLALPRDVLARYVGEYSLGPAKVTIGFGEGDSLTTQITGQRLLPMRATGPAEFEVAGVDAKVVFVVENGAVARLVIHQGGREMPAERIAAKP
jgi:D-alanyl-D-alanine carboxypeptidase